MNPTSVSMQSAVSEVPWETHAAMVAESLPIVMFTLDASGAFASISGRGCVMMEIDAAQVLNRPFSEIFADEVGEGSEIDRVMMGTSERRWSTELRGHVWEFYCKQIFPADTRTASLAGFALNVTQRRHIEEARRWHKRETEVLNSMSRALTKTLEISGVLAILQGQLAAQLNILGGAVYLPGDDGLGLYTAWGVPADLVERTSRLMRSGGISVGGQCANRHFLSPLFLDSQEDQTQWQSVVTVPLVCDDRSWGILVLYDTEPLVFTSHESSFFEMLGYQIGVALQNARMFQAVIDSREELRHLSQRLVSVQEAEQARIARELHDEFGQILTSMKLTLDRIEQPRTRRDTASQHLSQVRSLVDDMLAHVRQLTVELRTTVLDDFGLYAALEWYCERFTTQSRIMAHLEHTGFDGGRRFPEAVETAVYRIVQEALTNVARHAGVNDAYITLSKMGETANEQLRVTVQDFGRGFDTSAPRHATNNGLTGMRERALALGGTATIESAPGHGTRVEVLLPLVAS